MEKGNYLRNEDEQIERMNFMPANRDKKRQTKNTEIGLDGGSIENNFHSDNAYTDQGLENASKLEQAMNKGKTR